MNIYQIEIKWEGPYNSDCVVSKMSNGGSESDGYSGPDYGLYQIYGKHILCGEDTLLYIGKTTQQTFSERFKQHKKEWLDMEEGVKVYLGRIDDQRYSNANNWLLWELDVDRAEKILIYKYSPHYNSSGISQPPEMKPLTSISLIHNNCLIKKDKMHQLHLEDNVPRDWKPSTIRPKE